MDDSSTRVLAERQDTLCSHLRIAQELQSYILIILRGLRVSEDLSHLLIVLAAQHELYIVESLLCQ